MEISVILPTDTQPYSGWYMFLTVCVIILFIFVGILLKDLKNIKEKKQSRLNPLTFSESDSGIYFFVVALHIDEVLLKKDGVYARNKERYYKRDAIPEEFQKERTWFKVVYIDGQIQFSKDDIHHHI